MDQEITGRETPEYDIQNGEVPPPPSYESRPSALPLLGCSARRAYDEDAAGDRPARDTTHMNGNGTKPKDPSSLFWQQPIASDEEVNWFVPPLPRREEHGEQVVGLL